MGKDREKSIVPGEFAQIYRDLAEYESDFMKGVIDRKHKEFVIGFPDFVWRRSTSVREDAENFLSHFRTRRYLRIKYCNDPAERSLACGVSIKTLLNFVRNKCEVLASAARVIPEGTMAKEENEGMRQYWRRVGETVREASLLTQKI